MRNMLHQIQIVLDVRRGILHVLTLQYHFKCAVIKSKDKIGTIIRTCMASIYFFTTISVIGCDFDWTLLVEL